MILPVSWSDTETGIMKRPRATLAISQPRPFYYLENFGQALAGLKTRYADLLLDQELAFIETFARLPQASAALLVRMVMREGDLFRTSKLRYAEIGPPERAAAPLVDL